LLYSLNIFYTIFKGIWRYNANIYY